MFMYMINESSCFIRCSMQVLPCKGNRAAPLLPTAYLWLKPEIDHAIGFVQHDVVALVEHRIGALEAVDEAAGRADHDLTALAQLEALVLDRLPANHRHHPVLGKVGQLAGFLLDLLRQFARGGKHARIGAFRLDVGVA